MEDSLKLPTSVPALVAESHKETTIQYAKAVTEYIERLRQTSRKIPESPNRKGCPYLTRISNEIGVPYWALRNASIIRDRLNEGIAELGMSCFEPIANPEALTYQHLLDAGSQWRADELKSAPEAEQQLYNTRTALRKFMGGIEKRQVRELGMSDVIGLELQEEFLNRKGLITESIDKITSRRKFSTEIDRWPPYYQRLVSENTLPPDFQSAFTLVLERTGVPLRRLADLADVDVTILMTWCHGEATPSQQSFPTIERIEKALGLPPKCLIIRINISRSKRFKLTDYPEYITVEGKKISVRMNDNLLGDLRRLLPDDFDKRTEKEREEMIAWFYSNRIEPQTAWARSQRFATRADAQFMMAELPPVVKGEWQELRVFKKLKVPPPGMKREGIWSRTTERMRYNSLRSILSPFTLPADREDPRICGLGLPSDVLTLAMLTCPKVLHWRTCWMGRRRYENYKLGESTELADDKESEDDDESEEKYSFADSNLIKDWSALLTPETGWLRQRPDLADHLRPIPGFIDETFIDHAKKAWEEVCDEAHAYYVDFAETIEEAAEELRDSFELIMPILESENPVAALRLFAQNVFKDRPEPHTSPFRMAKHMRNYQIVRLLSATALRSKNIRKLTYREDNTGHLRREGNRWVIEIPYMEFKNWQSSFFGPKKKRENYRKVLADLDGLYDHLDEYLKVHRPFLLQGESSDIVIVASAKKPLYSASGFRENYGYLTTYYLAHNPFRGSGIPGVLPHGPHSVRDIVATHVVKQTGSYDLAGYSIQDTGRTARKHYARFMPKDKIHLADEILNQGYLS